MADEKRRFRFLWVPLRGESYGCHEICGIVEVDSSGKPLYGTWFHGDYEFLIFDHGCRSRYELLQIHKDIRKSKGQWVRKAKTKSIAVSSKVAEMRKLAKKMLRKELAELRQLPVLN